MLLLVVALLLTALIGAVMSAAFYGVVARFEADDVQPSLAREWRQPATVEYRRAAVMVYADH